MPTPTPDSRDSTCFLPFLHTRSSKKSKSSLPAALTFFSSLSPSSRVCSTPPLPFPPRPPSTLPLPLSRLPSLYDVFSRAWISQRVSLSHLSVEEKVRLSLFFLPFAPSPRPSFATFLTFSLLPVKGLDRLPVSETRTMVSFLLLVLVCSNDLEEGKLTGLDMSSTFLGVELTFSPFLSFVVSRSCKVSPFLCLFFFSS